MQTVKDMMGNELVLQSFPQRIISTVPSQTELLYDLGLDSEVVGITKFCIHPQTWFRSKERIGGTKNLNIEKIKSLQPDLIIANKEENTQSEIEALAALFPVWVSDISTVADATSMIQQVGKIIGRAAAANALAGQILQDFPDATDTKKSVAYFIWYRPWMSVGKDTFIHDVLHRCGLVNVFENKSRYPRVDVEALRQAAPEWVLLSSEPFPFNQKHVDEIKKMLPDATVKLVDGEMFSWYGSRMLKATSYLKGFLQEVG